LPGFGLSAPAVHSANEKVVRYLGTATTMGSEIDKKLFEDTGIKVKYIPVTTDEVTKRVLTQPNSFDIVDTEYFSLPKLVPSGQYPWNGLKADKGVRQYQHDPYAG
jgi:putative spermidine/putrescine transport system substrate-binding protein